MSADQIEPNAVATAEAALLRELTVGAAVSAVTGAASLAWGVWRSDDWCRGFGRQTLGWAAVNGVIAAVGTRGLRTNDEAPQARARKLRKTLAINAVLDVGYVAAGVAVARSKHPRFADAQGDGVAVVAQGLFLLWLDAKHARTFQRLNPSHTFGQVGRSVE